MEVNTFQVTVSRACNDQNSPYSQLLLTTHNLTCIMPAGGMVLVLPEHYTFASDRKAPEQDYLSQGSPALAQETVQHDARQHPEPAAAAPHL